MFLEVKSLARSMSSSDGFVFWFGGSSSLMSRQDIFSIRDTRSDTSIKGVGVGMGRVEVKW